MSMTAPRHDLLDRALSAQSKLAEALSLAVDVQRDLREVVTEASVVIEASRRSIPAGLPRLLSAEEVAEQTGLTKAQVYEQVRRHRLRAVRMGTAVRIPEYEVIDWINRGGDGPVGEEAGGED